MIQTTGRNPLALACLASNFAYAEDKTKLRLWKEAYTALREILDCPETAIVLTPDTPPRSLWAAMKICFDSLETSDAKNILFLMYACEGESVPEEVLRILHTATKTSSGLFLKSIQELRSRELLKLSAGTIAIKIHLDDKHQTGQQESSALSLLTTVKLYMDQHMPGEEKMRSLFGALLGDAEINAESSVQHEAGSGKEAMQKEKTKVAITLCALYFDRDHINKLVAKAATQASNVSKIHDWDPTLKDRRRKAIEPLIWLLDQQEEDDWTESNVHSVRQVLPAALGPLLFFFLLP